MNKEVKPALQGDIMMVGEFAEFLQLHPSMQLHSSTIYRLLRRGTLCAFKVGSDWGISRESIDRLVRLESSKRSARGRRLSMTGPRSRSAFAGSVAKR